MKKKIKRILKKVKKVLKNTKLAKIYRSYHTKSMYKRYAKKYNTNDQYIIFSSFWGKKYNCNPKGIYLQMLKMPEYNDRKFIWAFVEPEKYEFLNSYKNTKVVKLKSKEYYKYCALAKYWITNVSMPSSLKKKKNQIYINTWHGKPIKKIGCNICFGNNLRNGINKYRKAYIKGGKQYDYLFSAAPYFTQYMATAYGMKKDDKKVIEVGYPRNDFLFTFSSDDVKKMKADLGINENKKVIFYAPTWRNYEYNEKNHSYVNNHALDMDKLAHDLGDDYVIIYKTHNMEEKNVDRELYKNSAINVDFVDDINYLYIISDMLISDYSGAIFDYAILKRPIVYYMWDKEQYINQSQGIDFNLDELPGPVVEEQKYLCKTIKNEIKNFKYNDKYEKFNKKYNCLDSAECAEKFIKKYIR